MKFEFENNFVIHLFTFLIVKNYDFYEDFSSSFWNYFLSEFRKKHFYLAVLPFISLSNISLTLNSSLNSKTMFSTHCTFIAQSLMKQFFTIFYPECWTKRRNKKSPKLFGKQVAWNKRGIYRNLSNMKLRRGIIWEPAEKNLTTPPKSVVNWSFSFCLTCSEAKLKWKKLPKINSWKGLLLCAPHKIYFNE